METDRLMRDADPVAGWRVDAESSQATAMLAGILAQPRSDTAQPSGLAAVRRPRTAVRRVRHRRLAFGGVAAAAVAVALAASTIWLDGPGGATPAYAVTANPDGSVELIVEWDRLDDPAGLAADLRQAGVPTELRTGLPERFCPGAGRDYTSEALNKLGPEGEPVSTDGYVMQPELFPDGSVLVISTHADPQTQFFYTMMYLAPAGSTSCTLSGTLGSARYTGPSPHPTTMWWPQPAE
ncbi:hypothetical protein O7608_01130 [Solwaraspora sp. WMMA2056]|uniref:hypothetical protein n=1 Tax=Solwaraspora sp. WMMA2056 TaxID=3015161 RepID=UPI00259B090B|nr:hypothetical protein [Solwaraspora sp. WMMA2056]WJK41094.1 hypothetical protein O7608_01130 [Solwaraspora sp. WMMA2056]